MEKPTLLIADSNEDFRLALARALQDHYRILCTGDGKEALLLLRHETPETLILDPTLPGMDGLTLLETAVAEDIRPMVLIASRFLTTYLQESAAQLGVGYLMCKPCDISAVVMRVRDLKRRLKPAAPDLRTLICRCLLDLGFSTKHDGFQYLIDAVAMMTGDVTLPVTKIIYPSVARIYNCSPENVERSIRTAMGWAWLHRNTALWQEVFPFCTDHRPSNADFLTHLAVHIQLTHPEGIL